MEGQMSKPGEPPKQVGKSKEVQREEPPTVEPAGLLPSADDDAWLDAETFDSLVSSVADEIEDESEEDIEEDIEEESQGSDEPISEMELSEDTENEVAVEAREALRGYSTLPDQRATDRPEIFSIVCLGIIVDSSL